MLLIAIAIMLLFALFGLLDVAFTASITLQNFKDLFFQEFLFFVCKVNPGSFLLSLLSSVVLVFLLYYGGDGSLDVVLGLLGYLLVGLVELEAHGRCSLGSHFILIHDNLRRSPIMLWPCHLLICKWMALALF